MNEISRSNRTKNVLSLQAARERARQLRGGSNGHVSKRLGLSVWNSETTQLSNQRLLERLEAENAQLIPILTLNDLRLPSRGVRRT